MSYLFKRCVLQKGTTRGLSGLSSASAKPATVAPSERYAKFEDCLRNWPPNIYVPAEKLRLHFDYTPRDTDVFGVGYPKSGTTWLNYCLYTLSQKGELPPSNLDDVLGCCGHGDDVGDKDDLVTFSRVFGGDPNDETSETWRNFERRIFFSHVPRDLLTQNGNAKYVVTVRDGRDALLSSFRFFAGMKPELQLAMHGHSSNWDERFENFMNGNIAFGSWYDFTKTWYDASKTDPRVLVFTYEEAVSDHVAVMKRINNHCEFGLSDSQLQEISHNLTFKSMKKREHTMDHSHLDIYKDKSNFLRKGRSGAWKEMWSEEQNHRFLGKFHEVFGSDHPWSGTPYETKFHD